MAIFKYQDTPTIDLSTDAEGDFVANIKGAGAANAVLDALCDDPDLLAEWKGKIDVRIIDGGVIDAQAGTYSFPLSNGTTVTGTITGTPVAGSYGANAAGDVEIAIVGGGVMTLTGLVSPADNDVVEFITVDNGDGTFTVTPELADGSTLPPFTVGQDTISPEDVDFASTVVTVNADGSVAIDYVDSNGDPIATSAIPATEMLGDLSLGADGCTLEGNLDNGTPVSVSLCDLISDIVQTVGPNGEAVFTHEPSGVSWTIGSASGADNGDGTATITFQDGTTLCVSTLASLTCDDDCLVATYKDGSRKAFFNTFDRTRVQSTNAELQDITTTTQVDEIVATMETIVHDFGKCPRCLQLEVFSGFFTQTVGSGSVLVGPEFSIDGGPHSSMFTGGSEIIRPLSPDTENNYTDNQKVGPLSGVRSIDVRWRVRAITLSNGAVIRQTTANGDINDWKMDCCDLEDV